MSKALLGWLLATTLILASCSNQPSQQTRNSEQNRALKQWQLNGKIGLRQPNDAVSAQLNWRQCDDYFDIRLTGPLGQGALHLFGTANHATLQTPDGSQQGKLASLMQQHVGWPVPIADLASWALGIPAKGDYQTVDNDSFSQHHWLLSYPSWQAVKSYSLPQKLLATRGNYRVTIIIHQWQLSPDCSNPY
jgi:outer membrane lipoprotein LolB